MRGGITILHTLEPRGKHLAGCERGASREAGGMRVGRSETADHAV